MAAIASTDVDPALLAAARAGDEDAYRRIVEPHRGALHAHCYRMLGSPHDADDAVQDALLRAWRALPRFEGRSTPRSWLYRIGTNACLDVIARRRRRVLPTDRGGDAPLAETVWLEPYPDDGLPDEATAAPDARYDRRESVELAFIAALQLLPATQRAVLIMREVLGFSAKETADTLDTTVASVNSALQRARRSVEERLPDRSQQATLRALGDERLRAIVDGYVRAWESGDVDAVVSMLAEDAVFSMPPLDAWYRGHDAIRAFLPTGPMSMPRRFVPLPGANGQPAFATYCWEEEPQRWRANAVHVIALRGDRIAELTAFLDPAVHRRFGIPEHLPGPTG